MDKGCGGGVGGVGIDDLGEGMQCSNHPYRNSPGGICAFCLQEKLGKLVSSSKSNPSFFPIPPSSSSSSPSFRSEGGGAALGFAASSSSLSLSLSLSVPPSSSSSSNGNNNRHPGIRGRIPFSSVSQKKTKNIDVNSMVVLKRSKSSAAPRRHHHLLEADEYSPRKRSGFWSFLHLPSSRRRNTNSNSSQEKGDSKPSVHPTPTSVNASASNTHSAAAAAAAKDKDKRVGGESSSSRRVVVVGRDYGDENESPNSSSHDASSLSFGRKVARSRSVGCGSRSFSGDFLERISTGFGDCTLRRVESQREAKQQATKSDRMKERVKCGGIFGGFSMTSSSSSSSYWASESDRMNSNVVHRTGRGEGGLAASSSSSSSSSSAVAVVPHGRNKGWGWAFASPMRAFRPSSSKRAEDKDSGNAAKRSTNYQLQLNNNNKTDADANVDADAAVPVPKLSAIPSLLTVGG